MKRKLDDIMDRAVNSIADRAEDHIADRVAAHAVNHTVDHKADCRADRGTGRRADRGTDREADHGADRGADHRVDLDHILGDIPRWSAGSVMREFSIREAQQTYLMVYTRLVDEHKIHEHRMPQRKVWWRRPGKILRRVCLEPIIKWWKFKRSEDVREGYQDSGEFLKICTHVVGGVERRFACREIFYDMAERYIREHPLSGYGIDMQSRVYSLALHGRVIGELVGGYGEYIYEKAEKLGDMDMVPGMVNRGVSGYLLGTIYYFNECKGYKEKGSRKSAYEILQEAGLELELKTSGELQEYPYPSTYDDAITL